MSYKNPVKLHMYMTTNIDSGDYDGYHEQVIVNASLVDKDGSWRKEYEGEIIHYCFVEPPRKYIKEFNNYTMKHRYRLLLVMKTKYRQLHSFATLNDRFNTRGI